MAVSTMVTSLALVFLMAIRLVSGVGDDYSVNLLTLVPFTFEGKDHPYYATGRRNNLGFSHMAAALLAVNHFNERNPQVVPQLAELSKEECAIHFGNSSRIEDTHGRGNEAVSVVLQQLYKQQTPDAIAGAFHDETALDLSVVASSLKIPFVAYGGSNIRLVTPYYFPYSSRTAADAKDIGAAVVSFLFHLERTNFTGILQATTDTASQLSERIFDSAANRGADVDVVTYIPPVLSGTQSDIEDSMRRLKETGFRTIVLIVETIEEELQLIADAAEKFGMNSGEYVWVIMGDIEIDFFSSPDATANDNVAKFLKGAAFLRALDGFTWNPENDRFLASWRNQSVPFVREVNQKNPIEPGAPGYFAAQDDYFQKFDPEHGAGFLYDAIISLGLGLCQAKQSDDLSEWSIVAGTRLGEFDGATGLVHFGSNSAYPGGRAAGTVTFGAFNLLPPIQKARVASGHGYVLTNYLLAGNNTWTNVSTFYFADGSTTPPDLLRDPPVPMFLSSWARIIGFTLFGIALLAVICSAVWIYKNRTKRIVKASQPEFLYTLVFGSACISFAILVNSFDVNYGWSPERLGKLCTSTPWLVFMGVLIIYCALFSKLWRINRLLQFRRVTIKVTRVLWPFAILFVAAAVALTVWTVTEGFVWILMESDGEIMGKCYCSKSVPYFAPIFVLAVIPVLLTVVMAWKTRDIDKTYSESGWIFILIIFQLQVLFVAIPVLFIMEARSTNARYLCQVAIFFLYPMSTLGFIIAPKIYGVHFQQEQKRGVSNGTVHVSGFVPPSTSSNSSRPNPSTNVAANSSRNESSEFMTVASLRNKQSQQLIATDTTEGRRRTSSVTFDLNSTPERRRASSVTFDLNDSSLEPDTTDAQPEDLNATSTEESESGMPA